jgi:hypothetical protein
MTRHLYPSLLVLRVLMHGTAAGVDPTRCWSARKTCRQEPQRTLPPLAVSWVSLIRKVLPQCGHLVCLASVILVSLSLRAETVLLVKSTACQRLLTATTASDGPEFRRVVYRIAGTSLLLL